jgi:hypothetical protein
MRVPAAAKTLTTPFEAAFHVVAHPIRSSTAADRAGAGDFEAAMKRYEEPADMALGKGFQVIVVGRFFFWNQCSFSSHSTLILKVALNSGESRHKAILISSEDANSS